ncbi:hypothetical protein B0H13DRAFT_2324766 [Mycena leptocephala]|nr:hypothetical protein B0H13DRAFT_2324766 [Mycena leptocephala]
MSQSYPAVRALDPLRPPFPSAPVRYSNEPACYAVAMLTRPTNGRPAQLSPCAPLPLLSSSPGANVDALQRPTQVPDTPHAASVAFPNPSRPQCRIVPTSLTSCAPPFPRDAFVCARELPTLHHCTTATTTATSSPSIHRVRLPRTPLVFATAAALVIHPLRRHRCAHHLCHGRCAIRAVPIPSAHPPPTAVPIDAGRHAHRRCLTTYFHLDPNAQAPSNPACAPLPPAL